MSILTEDKYLDEITFSNGSQADSDGTVADSWTDADTGTGASTPGITFDGKSCFKFDSGVAGSAIITRDIGVYSTPAWVSIKTYFDDIGALATSDYFSMVLQDSAYRCSVRFCSDGLFVYDGASWNEVGADIVSLDTWQEWTFKWTVAAAGVVDVYLNGTLVASSVDCSDATGGTDGTTTFTQIGTTKQCITYLDFIKIGVAQRSGGETLILTEGAELTIRTDTRWSANAPASYLGSLGSQTVNFGKLIYDGTDVRWLAVNTASGDSPIGTTITQGGVSGYYLGFYATKTSAPTTALGSATGFIKLREVTGGAFAAGALTFGAGTGAASATSADVTGWIEVVADSTSTITVARLGKHEIRGDWFYLDDTTGAVAQQIQIPTNGGGATTYCPGVWVETAEGSGEYEYWPSAAVAADGWSRSHLGAAVGEQDRRQNFCKDVGGGLIQFGEVSDISASTTYANVAAQASTYSTIAHSSTYAVVSNVCTITYPTGHLLKTGATVGVNFTDGGASALDGNFAITVIDAYTYSFALVTGDTTGACVARPGLTIGFTAHALGVGDSIWIDFTSGAGAPTDGDFTIYAVTGANAYLVAYPHTATLAGGNASVYSRYRITSAAHGLAIGNRVYLNFTSGSGVDGIYTIVAVATDTFDIVANNDASADTGNVTIQQIIGNVPPDNCHVRIPNVFLREAATATRASNLVNATIASRPEWATSTAGAIDIEFAYSTWYHNFSQAFSVKMHDSSYYNAAIISECATALDLNNVGCSNSTGSLALAPLTLTSNFAGGTIQNCKFARGGTPASNGHAITAQYCIGQTFTNIEGIGVLFAKSSGYAIGASNCSNLTINSCRDVGLAGVAILNTCNTVTVNDADHVDRLIGYTNSTAASYGINSGAGSVNILVDGLTIGYGGTISNVHPFTALVYSANGTSITFRNIGTFDVPIPCGTFRPNAYSLGTCFTSGGNNYGLRCQRIYADDNMRTSPLVPTNSDKSVSLETVYGGIYTLSAMAIFLQLDAGLNSVIKGNRTGANSVTGQSSVYGTHFMDMFMGDTTGRYVLMCNEPTTETNSYFTMVAGTKRFNSAGGILMSNVNDQAVWEDQYFRKGHTAFANTTPTMSGGTIENYTLEYDIDVNDGTGFTGSYTALTGANLSGETIDPALGFRLKIRITTTTANLSAITYLRIDTISTASAQENNLYNLDEYTLTINGLETGTKVAFLTTGTETLLDNVATTSGASATYTFPDSDVGDTVDVAILKAGYVYQKITYTLTAANVSIPVVMESDIVYDTADTDVTFNGATHRIVADAGVTDIVVQIGIYSAWVDWALTSDNLKYEQAIRTTGGDEISATKELGITYFLLNDWRIRPDEDDYRLIIEGNIYTDPAGSSVVVSTINPHSVVIEMQVSNLSDANLAQMPEIEYSSFNGEVTIDVDNGTAGTAYPIGTSVSPVNNLANALTIAAYRGLKRLKINSDLTVASGQDITEYTLVGKIWDIVVTLESGSISTNTNFEKLSVQGVMDGYWNVITNCWVFTITNFCGWMKNSSFVDVTLAPATEENAGESFFDDTLPDDPNTPSIIRSATGSVISMTNTMCDISIKDVIAGNYFDVDFSRGILTVDSSCTGGDVVVFGIGSVTGTSGGTTINQDNLISNESVQDGLLTEDNFLALK
jgi:hypothetical protein